MKMAFVVCNEFFIVEVMEHLRSAGNRLLHAMGPRQRQGPRHGTALGTGAHGSPDSVLMIAFEDDAVWSVSSS